MGCSASGAPAAIVQASEASDGNQNSPTSRDNQKSCKGSEEFHARYRLGPKLGLGNFAQVRLGTPVSSTPNKIAVKIMYVVDSRNKEDERLLECVRLEESIWKRVGRHNNCVQLFDTFYGDVFAYMVMEKCCCCLLRHILRMDSVNERTLGHLFVGMLQGLAHVHSVGVVHRDVKPDNFMIGEDGYTVKLCDFGLSDKLNDLGTLSGRLGTAPYMSPEMLEGLEYDGKIDMWALGVVMYVFLFGRFPYEPKEKQAKAMKTEILRGKSPSFASPDFRTDCAVQLVKSLLVRDALQRPTAQEALDMEFMKQVVTNQHAQAVDLPSLRPMVLSGKAAGAFESRDLRCDDNMDCILHDMQVKCHGSSFGLVSAQREKMLGNRSPTSPIKQVMSPTARGPHRKFSDVVDDASTSCESGTSSRDMSPAGSDWDWLSAPAWSASSSLKSPKRSHR